jgi:hypothetical protein
VTTYPNVDDSRERLHRAGWSVGENATAAGWVVSGANGENRLLGEGVSQSAGCWRACEEARAMGMLAPLREFTQ